MIADSNAETAARLALSQAPHDIGQRVEFAVALRDAGRHAEAIALLREGMMFCFTREDRLVQLAEAMIAIDALPDALEVLQAARRIAPGDEDISRRISELAAQLKDGETATRQLFNQYAARFEDHLASLSYIVPAEIERALLPYSDRLANATVLDLGCGTGLMGERLRHLIGSGQLTGIDLSPAMLEVARAKGVYDELIAGDVTVCLSRFAGSVGLVVAADVLMYIGDLEALFAAVMQALTPGGLFVFTVERQNENGFSHNQTQRFTHSESYLRSLAAMNFNVLDFRPITPRFDRGQPVDGLLIVLEALIGSP